MTRGQQDVYGWWRKSSSGKVLGDLKDCMESLAEHCLLSAQGGVRNATLRILSLSDGCVNNSRAVPSSVLLARAFASLDKNAFPRDLKRVKIFGADVKNPRWKRVQSLMQASWVPPWLELQHVHLDNETHFGPQLHESFAGSSLHHLEKFDIILMRQGLCYCKDHSFDCLPPEKLEVTGVKGDGGCGEDGPSGTYVLEPIFRNGRPSYKKGGRFVLYWRPHLRDWVLEEYDGFLEEMGHDWRFVWANVVKDCGIPACAQEPWHVWDGKTYVMDRGVSCAVKGPWSSYERRPPHACKCCGGISLHAEAIESFMGRVAAVLDERQPKAFAFLHSGHYQGLQTEVKEFHSEMESAAERFNSTKTSFAATLLRKDGCEETTPYWQCIDGLLLSSRLA
eukprot:gene28313-35073_t